jgi:hypothetical protein
MLKSRLRWSAIWLREAAFCHRGLIVRWALAGGIDRFLIATLDHADSLGFVVRISLRANPEDRVVVDGVSISGRVGPSIGSVVAGCLTTAWNVIAEFLRLRGNSKPIIVVRRAFCSWAGCSRSSSCTTFLIVESGAQDCHHAPLWMTTFRTGTACPSGTSRRRSTMLWVHKDESQRFPPSWRASVDVVSSDIWSRIGENVSRWDQSHVNTRHDVLDWFGPSPEIIVLRPVLMYYTIEIGSSLFLSECPRYGSTLSIYSWGTAS